MAVIRGHYRARKRGEPRADREPNRVRFAHVAERRLAPAVTGALHDGEQVGAGECLPRDSGRVEVVQVRTAQPRAAEVLPKGWRLRVRCGGVS